MAKSVFKGSICLKSSLKFMHLQFCL